MSYANHHHHSRMGPTPAVPFSEFTAPFAIVAQGVLAAFETAARLVSAGVAAVARMRRRHQAQCQLMSLDDRTLRDIGVSRSEIRYLAQRAADEPTSDGRW